MLYNGQKLTKPNVEILVLPRDGFDLIIKAEAIPDMAPFDKLVPEPKVPVKLAKGGVRVPDLDNLVYKSQLERRNKLRFAYIVIQSLKATTELVWERIKENDPDTWEQYDDELKEAGLSDIERGRIYNLCVEANALSESKLEEAKKRFLAGRPVDDQLDSQRDGAISTPSGEPANG